MEKKFSFRCQCTRCQLGRRTDKPLLELLRRQKHFKVRPSLQDAYELIELYQKIGMDIVLDVPYRFVSKMYEALGETAEAELWAERSAKVRMLSDTRAPFSIPIFNVD